MIYGEKFINSNNECISIDEMMDLLEFDYKTIDTLLNENIIHEDRITDFIDKIYNNIINALEKITKYVMQLLKKVLPGIYKLFQKIKNKFDDYLSPIPSNRQVNYQIKKQTFEFKSLNSKGEEFLNTAERSSSLYVEVFEDLERIFNRLDPASQKSIYIFNKEIIEIKDRFNRMYNSNIFDDFLNNPNYDNYIESKEKTVEFEEDYKELIHELSGQIDHNGVYVKRMDKEAKRMKDICDSIKKIRQSTPKYVSFKDKDGEEYEVHIKDIQEFRLNNIPKLYLDIVKLFEVPIKSQITVMNKLTKTTNFDEYIKSNDMQDFRGYWEIK